MIQPVVQPFEQLVVSCKHNIRNHTTAWIRVTNQ